MENQKLNIVEHIETIEIVTKRKVAERNNGCGEVIDAERQLVIDGDIILTEQYNPKDEPYTTLHPIVYALFKLSPYKTPRPRKLLSFERKQLDLNELDQKLIKAIQAYVEGVVVQKLDQTMRGVLESAVKSENVTPHNS